MRKQVFTKSEKQVISAMYQLDRWATIYEIAEWSELSSPTVRSVLMRLKRKKIVESKLINKKRNWRIIE